MILFTLLLISAEPALPKPDRETQAALAVYGFERDWKQCLKDYSLPKMMDRSVDAVLTEAYRHCSKDELWLRRSLNHAAEVFWQSKDPETLREMAKEPVDADRIIATKKAAMRASLMQSLNDAQQRPPIQTIKTPPPITVVKTPAPMTDEKACAALTKFSADMMKEVPKMIDAATRLDGVVTLCSAKMYATNKFITVPVSTFREGWQGRKQQQWNDIICKNSDFLPLWKRGWRFTQNMTFVSGERFIMDAHC